jgi:hypothetical protein
MPVVREDEMRGPRNGAQFEDGEAKRIGVGESMEHYWRMKIMARLYYHMELATEGGFSCSWSISQPKECVQNRQ